MSIEVPKSTRLIISSRRTGYYVSVTLSAGSVFEKMLDPNGKFTVIPIPKNAQVVPGTLQVAWGPGTDPADLEDIYIGFLKVGESQSLTFSGVQIIEGSLWWDCETFMMEGTDQFMKLKSRGQYLLGGNLDIQQELLLDQYGVGFVAYGAQSTFIEAIGVATWQEALTQKNWRGGEMDGYSGYAWEDAYT